jgi:uncharacterized protein YbjT (DUF2867 family)
MTSVLIFGPTGQAGSVAARTAGDHGANVWLAMRDTTKSIPGLSEEAEKNGNYHRIQADLQKPETVTEAVKTSGAKRAFIYLVHGATDHQKSAIEAMKAAGIEFVVFLSSFTIKTTVGLRDIPPSELIPYVHAQVEAVLDDTFGSDNYVALRPGAFISNLLAEKSGIIAGDVPLYGGVFEQDNIVPSDIGRVAGTILVNGPKNGQKKVYLYGPEILSKHDTVLRIGKALGKDLKIRTLDEKEGFEQSVGRGMPEFVAKYMVEALRTKGPDKGNGEIFPKYEEGVQNVELYTGKKAMGLEEWVKENKAVFDA